jgi:hypothetical protein
MFISVPALIGISSSPGVFPVLISGPFYHRELGLIFCAHLDTYGIQGHCQRAARLNFLGLLGIVDDRLVVLHSQQHIRNSPILLNPEAMSIHPEKHITYLI